MRNWLIVGLVAALLATAGGLYIASNDDRCEGNASTVYDGAVLPGGPQTADEALEGFLSVTDNDLGRDLPDDLADYARTEVATGRVTFTNEDLVISAGQRPNGWFIDSTTIVCDRT